MNLPETKFNMRANSVQREPELQRQWASQRTYETLRDTNPGVRACPPPGPLLRSPSSPRPRPLHACTMGGMGSTSAAAAPGACMTALLSVLSSF